MKKLAAVVAVVGLVGCGAEPAAFVPATKCYLQGSSWRLESNGKPCDFYSAALAGAINDAAAARLVGPDVLASAVVGSNVWVHMEGVMCGGSGATGCTLWRDDGSFEIHVGGNAGAILHELLHVVEVRGGVTPEESALHPRWNERRWASVSDAFEQTMLDRDRVASP